MIKKINAESAVFTLSCLFSACHFLLKSSHVNSRSWVFLCTSILSSDADSFVKNRFCQCLKPWQGSQQEVPESHEAEPKEETENMKAVKDTTPKSKETRQAK